MSYVDDTTLMAESEEDLMILLKKGNEESEKPGLKANASWLLGIISLVSLKLSVFYIIR